MPTNQLAKRAVLEELAIMKPEAKNMQQVFKDNLEGELISRFDLEAIKVPSGGDTEWVISDAEGSKMVESFEGIIVMKHTTRGYWPPKIDNETGKEVDSMGDPPDCASNDGVHGDGSPGGECHECPHSQWDTGKGGKGQACKKKNTLYILLPDSFLPTVLDCPPGSLKDVLKYFTSLTRKGHSYFNVVTRFALTPERNDEGVKYAKVAPTMARILEPDENKAVDDFRKNFASAIQKRVDTSDY